MIELKTSHAEFHALHEVAASGRGKLARIDRDLLARLLIDHSTLVGALRSQTPTKRSHECQLPCSRTVLVDPPGLLQDDKRRGLTSP